jgi:hypothetical protein
MWLAHRVEIAQFRPESVGISIFTLSPNKYASRALTRVEIAELP